MANEKLLKKLIYFDENSATDLIYVHNEGQIEKVVKDIEGSKNGQEIDLNGEISINTPFFSFLKAKLSTGTKLSYDNHSENLLSQVVINTVLTDYLKISNDEHIKKIIEVKVYPFPNSLTFYKLVTPYMAMTEGQVKIDSNFSINLAKMDIALEKGKGYYEMIVDDKDENIVLRFNLDSFRNSYSLADLVKMKLNFHAIEVGEINKNMLNIDKEFSLENKEISGFDLGKEPQDSNDVYKVYDVIMAGIFR